MVRVGTTALKSLLGVVVSVWIFLLNVKKLHSRILKRSKNEIGIIKLNDSI